MTVNYLSRTWSVEQTGRESAPYILTDITGKAQPIKLIQGGVALFPQRGLTVLPGLFKVVDGVMHFVPCR